MFNCWFSDYKKFSNSQIFEEKAYLVGVDCRGKEDALFSTEDSLKELAQLADTAGLLVVGSASQKYVFLLAAIRIGVSYLFQFIFVKPFTFGIRVHLAYIVLIMSKTNRSDHEIFFR